VTPSRRLIYVIDRFPELSETFIAGEIRELRRTGDDVRVYARARGDGHDTAERATPVRYRPNRGRRAAAVAATAVRAPRGTLRAVRWACGQRRHERGMLEAFADACAVRAEVAAADHVHAHFAHWPASVAVLASLMTGTPCSFTAHARDLFLADPGALRRKVAVARFAAAVSDHTREVLAAAAPRDAARVHVVRNGIDLGRYRPEPSPPTDPLVLTVARLVEKKGVDVVVDACAQSESRADWVVVGDGPLRAALERRAAEACPGRLRFTGALDDDGVAALLRRAGVFVLPCRVAADGDRDALPVALVEALAAGVPAVTTPVAGIPEVVRDGESGYLVSPDDPEAVAQAVDRLLTDAELHERMRAAALEAAAAYDIGACVAELRSRLLA
jgi:glycosyltransferase involved in cell wall biosynthesis